MSTLMVATVIDGRGNVLKMSTDCPGGSDHGILTKLEGWFGVDVRTDRHNWITDGAYAGPQFRTGRSITLGGFQHKLRPDQVLGLVRKISGLFPPESAHRGHFAGEVVVQLPDGVLKAVGVKPDGAPRFDYNLHQGWVEFEVPLFSGDPFLYAAVPRSYTFRALSTALGLKYPLFSEGPTGPVTGVLEYGTEYSGGPQGVTNQGNAIAYPMIRVSGDMPSGFQIDTGGSLIVYTGAVVPTAPVDINLADGRASQGGADRTYLLRNADWWGVQPGQIVYPELTPLGAGTGEATIVIYDTYQ